MLSFSALVIDGICFHGTIPGPCETVRRVTSMCAIDAFLARRAAEANEEEEEEEEEDDVILLYEYVNRI